MEFMVDENWKGGHFNVFTEYEPFMRYIRDQQDAGRKISLVLVTMLSMIFSAE